MINLLWTDTWVTTFNYYEILMINDGESHAIIYEIYIVDIWVDIN